MKKSRPAKSSARKPYGQRRRLPPTRHKSDAPWQKADVTIRRLGARADGLVEIDGQEIAVPKFLPGEAGTIAYQGKRGRVVSITRTAPERREAPCPHFSACGGCQTQHMTPEFEKDWRHKMVQEIFAKAGMGDIKIEGTAVSPLHSRRRATFSAEMKDGAVATGFNRQASHAIVDIDHCLVLEPALLEARQIISQIVKKLATENARRFSAQVTKLENGLDMDFLGRPEESLSLNEREFLGTLLSESTIVRFTLEGGAFFERETPQIDFASLSAPFPVGGFLQATREAEEHMQQFIAEHTRKGAVLDLFAGCGTFSLPLARQHKVQAVEIAGPAVDCLKTAAKYHSLDGLSVEERNLEQNPLPATDLGAYDTIILDPPRGGAAAQIREIAASAADHVIYISCNPKTFARDAKKLEEAGFAISPVQLIDQFRYSAHIELACVLTRGGQAR